MTATVRLNLLKLVIISILVASGLVLIHPVFAEDATTGATSRKELIQQRVEKGAESRKENFDSRRTAIKEKMASREATLKAQFEAFKDKRKAEIAQRVNTNLNKVNLNQTTQMQKHLDKMSALLDKLEARVNTNSKDPAATKAAIADARAKITIASSAVKSQSEKDYTISVTTESRIKADAQAKREELYKDIKATRQQVIDARSAVANALKVAKGGTTMKEATSSGQQ